MFWTIVLNEPKIREILEKTEMSDIESSKAVMDYGKMIYLFKMEYKNVPLREICNISNCP